MKESNTIFINNREARFVLPIKIFAVITVILLLYGCTSKTFTPVVQEEFEQQAVYTFGDFSYKCKIVKTADFVSITPLETAAKGMVIKSDGNNVVFKQGNLEKSFAVTEVDVTNPAVVLYNVFNSLNVSEVQLSDEIYLFNGTVGAGAYSLTLTRANNFELLKLPDADITVQFINN